MSVISKYIRDRLVWVTHDGHLDTDIDDRSIDYAFKNVARNGMEQTITIMKSSPPDIFPRTLFKESERMYVIAIMQRRHDAGNILNVCIS